MKKQNKSLFFILFFTFFILLVFLLLQPLQIYFFNTDISVLFPSGIIALEERNLLFIIQAAMLLIIVPVYILTFVFSWKYRADNKTSTYDPDLTDHKLAEYIWWGVPFLMVVFIGGITWIKTYELDPYKPIESKNKTLTIDVVALQWKWLFIYPEQQIATINYIQIPKDTPIHFNITADAPMNSFWIPDLGGQIYAMQGMKTELNLIANATGEFRGSSANISGEGFAGMHFITKATTEEDFNNWVASIQKSPEKLDDEVYQILKKPTINVLPKFYALKEEGLFDRIVMEYMRPPKEIKKNIK